MFAVLLVRQCFGRINGKHKINILCVLCGSAVKKAFNFNKNCLNIYCRISNPYVATLGIIQEAESYEDFQSNLLD
jgi:hypothetical protein